MPPGMDFIQVRKDLPTIPAVGEVNDLHIRETGADQKPLAAHLQSKGESSDSEAMRADGSWDAPSRLLNHCLSGRKEIFARNYFFRSNLLPVLFLM